MLRVRETIGIGIGIGDAETGMDEFPDLAFRISRTLTELCPAKIVRSLGIEGKICKLVLSHKMSQEHVRPAFAAAAEPIEGDNIGAAGIGTVRHYVQHKLPGLQLSQQNASRDRLCDASASFLVGGR